MDARTYEPLLGEIPYMELDRHPDGVLEARQVTAWLRTLRERAAVWDRTTGRLVWAPDDVIALCWLRGGAEIALIREQYARAADHPDVIATPLQREFGYVFARHTWPAREPLSACRISAPMGWPKSITISPQGDLAAMLWHDQRETFVEFVALDAAGDSRMDARGLALDPQTNLSSRPVFSPDGRLIALAYQHEWMWWLGDQELDERAPSPGGTYEVGRLLIYDVRQRVSREWPLSVSVPAGWHPGPPLDGYWPVELLREPAFTPDGRQISIALPTGETRTITLEE